MITDIDFIFGLCFIVLKKKRFLKLIELGLLSKFVALFTLVVIFSFDSVASKGIS